MYKQRPYIAGRSRSGNNIDVTLINLNLMLAQFGSCNDKENYIPLGILYIASFLEEKGYSVEFIDYQLYSHAIEFNATKFAETVGRTAGLVGISSMSNMLPFAILCAQQIKKRNSEAKIVLGGSGPTPVAKEIIDAFPFIDSVVNGEGERTMFDFLKNGVSPLPKRKIVSDLDSLPLPAYHLIDHNLYDAAPSLITSRGCPYKCLFCTETTNFDRRVRFRSPESVIKEMHLLHSASNNICFLFQDDNINLNPTNFDKLLHHLETLSFQPTWKAFSRVDIINENIMKRMANSGCVQIRYGIESGSNVTLKTLQKGFTIEKAYESVALSVKHFKSVHVSFMWGFPFENIENAMETLNAVEQFTDLGATVLLFEFAPLPGSRLYRQYPDNLIFSEDRYSFFVLGGMETVHGNRLESSKSQSDIYKLIKKYPRIFPGFYHYRQTDTLRDLMTTSRIGDGRRTPVLNEHDL